MEVVVMRALRLLNPDLMPQFTQYLQQSPILPLQRQATTPQIL